MVKKVAKKLPYVLILSRGFITISRLEIWLQQLVGAVSHFIINCVWCAA
ncbi:hypothetical protein FP742_00860 [Vibrio parahaemolyticus]|uniref:Uncharacterized protein n=2 Tax=Vibrio parahaemolyticus TaxID=670 RepID=A0A2R9VMH5_VIBPH|nr:hypothetical protein RK51_001025 [Vibrio parahaemolyticus]QGG31867.1 hypothetical protein GH799_01415 [Vibrio parahaemolyticus 10329]BAC58517.1 hypothetical protein [Vibrio parahaemolyticus RIMD 2210633]AUW38641.1 hypothetical protein AL464_23500 [Vibrio parahaemolyticus]AVJ53807.1 hypothetical protein A6J30_25115 [Vibrio parahaemolyticus]